MATCEWTAWASSRPDAASVALSYSATPVSSQEVSIPRTSIRLILIQFAPLTSRGPCADSKSQGKRAVRSGDAPLQAHRREDRSSHGAALPRVLREADRRAQAQARRRRQASPQASAQPDASAEAVLNLRTQITEDMKAAMRAKESARLSTIRLLLAAIKQREVDERIELDDAAVLGVIEKMIKQRRESIAQFEKASRTDLADAEKAEVQILSAYLPAQMSDAEIQKQIDSVISETGAAGAKDMGKVMAALKARLAGKADMGKVSGLVKAKLSG